MSDTTTTKYPHLSKDFFDRLIVEIGQVKREFSYNYVCDDEHNNNARYPICHFMYVINEARKRNTRTRYILRYRLGDHNLSFKTILKQTPTVNGVIEIGIPKMYKEIAETIYDNFQIRCKHCNTTEKTSKHPDYEHDTICDKCLKLRNRYLIEVAP